MCSEFDYLLSTDGGAAANGSAASLGYGSYCLEASTSQRQMVRLDFGRGVTNNEAEYRTLIAGLKDLVGRIQRAGKSPLAYSLLVHTDSQLMVGQLTRSWKIKAANPSTSSGQACALSWMRQSRLSRFLAAAIPHLRSGQAWSRFPAQRSCGCLATETEPGPLVGIRLFFFRDEPGDAGIP